MKHTVLFKMRNNERNWFVRTENGKPHTKRKTVDLIIKTSNKSILIEDLPQVHHGHIYTTMNVTKFEKLIAFLVTTSLKKKINQFI